MFSVHPHTFRFTEFPKGCGFNQLKPGDKHVFFLLLLNTPISYPKAVVTFFSELSRGCVIQSQVSCTISVPVTARDALSSPALANVHAVSRLPPRAERVRLGLGLFGATTLDFRA